MGKFLNKALAVTISINLVLGYLILISFCLDELFSKPTPFYLLFLANFGIIFGAFYLTRLILLIFKKLN